MNLIKKNMDIQQIAVIAIGVVCVFWIGMRMVRSFSKIGGEQGPCAKCPTGCELQRQFREKQQLCNKNTNKKKKSCCE